MLGLHVLNARDNSLMHMIFFDHAKGDPQVFREAIQQEAHLIREFLATRGVNYESLSAALVPSSKGLQAAFLYDWQADTSWNYAVGFAQKYLPLLRRDLRTSVLHGDLHNLGMPIPMEILNASLVMPREQHVNWQSQYAVYFSNLRPTDIVALHEGLSKEPGYTGYLDVSFSCVERDYLAETVTPLWVVAGGKVILDHGGDDPFVGEEDPVGFDLPKYGYEVISLINAYFTAFMSYKVESNNAFQASDDRILNLAAITGDLLDLNAMKVHVPPEKVDKYLLRDRGKLRLMTSIGLQNVTCEELAELIKNKLLSNYVYDFRFPTRDTTTFAVSAELEKPNGDLTRRLLGLKYSGSSRTIGLVTMY